MLKISIVTCSYNQVEFIRQNIESVLNQNYPNFEHLIIDGGSTDGTVEILKEYPHLDWVSEPDRGQSDALNKGFRRSTGDIIAWINSDDMLAPNALFNINNFFEQNPDKSVVIGNQVLIDRNGNILKVIPAEAFTLNSLLNTRHCSVMQNSTLIRRSVFNEVGFLDEDFHYTMDLELFVRIAQKYTTYTINKDLAYFRMWDGSKTGSSQLQFYKEIIKVKKKHHAKLISSGNIWLLCQFMKAPLKRILVR